MSNLEDLSAGLAATKLEDKESSGPSGSDEAKSKGQEEEEEEEEEEQQDQASGSRNLTSEELHEIWRKEKNRRASRRWRLKKEARLKDERRVRMEQSHGLPSAGALPGLGQAMPSPSLQFPPLDYAVPQGLVDLSRMGPLIGPSTAQSDLAGLLHASPTAVGQSPNVEQLPEIKEGRFQPPLSGASLPANLDALDTAGLLSNFNNLIAAQLAANNPPSAAGPGPPSSQHSPLAAQSGFSHLGSLQPPPLLQEGLPSPSQAQHSAYQGSSEALDVVRAISQTSRRELELSLLKAHEQNRALTAQVQQLQVRLQAMEKAAEDMLYEFKRLGKAQEADVKKLLFQIAGFHLVPGGFQSNKEAIVQLSLDLIDAANGGAATPQDTALKILDWNVQVHPSWSIPGLPTYTEVLLAFAHKLDDQIFLELPEEQFGNKNRVSLRAASQMHFEVVKKCYILLIKMVQAHLPVVFNGDNTAAALESGQAISRIMAIMSAFCHSWAIGQITSLATLRSVKPPIQLRANTTAAVNAQLAAFGADKRASLWQYWDQYLERVPLLLAKKERSERLFDEILSRLDHEVDQNLIPLFETVRELATSYSQLFEASHSLDLQSGIGCMSPLELGVLAGLQLPDRPAAELFEIDGDPFLSLVACFQSGSIPRA